MKYLFLYLITVNALSCILMHIDKKKAQKNRWRIPEATLMLFAAVGGSMGSLVGMYTARHKTKHLKFTLGVPVILAVQAVLGVFLYAQFG